MAKEESGGKFPPLLMHSVDDNKKGEINKENKEKGNKEKREKESKNKKNLVG